MADDPSWDDIFNSQPRPGENADPAPHPQSRRELRERQPKGAPERRRSEKRAPEKRVDEYGLPPQKKKRKLTWLWVLLSILVVLGGTATAVWFTFQPQIRHVLGWEDSNDYTGSGTGTVVITITNGQIGNDVAKTLATDGVTKTSAAFYALLLKQTPEVQFQPGSYALKSHMSAKAALAALKDPKNKVFTQVVLPEGITVKGVIARLANLSQSTGVSLDQLNAAAADYKSFGLPADAPSLEGYLFPASYNFEPKTSAHQMFQIMVTTMFKHLDAAGVAPADRNHVLTLAALTQKEGGSTKDFLKVARVWDNRLAAGMHLQSDATVSYGAGTSSINTTAAQRADKSNPYNTYANAGLPIGPISNPGDAAIAATQNPASGSWLYFVVVNCSTGETAFSTTFAEHQAAVAQLGAWLKQNPGGCN